MHLPLKPQPEKKWTSGVGTLLIFIVLATVVLWWQRERLMAQIPPQALPQLLPTPTLSFTTPKSSQAKAPPANQVALAYSAVVTNVTVPLSATLFLKEAEHPDSAVWGGRTNVQTYTIKSGDTLWGIAAAFDLTLNTLRWSNPSLERNPDLLQPNTQLIILPINGVYHPVTISDTLQSIAQRYGVSEADITSYPANNLTPPYRVQPGSRLVIPNGQKEIDTPPPASDPNFPLAWPLVGHVSQPYSSNHQAVDIGTTYGATVYAADAGTVIYSSWAHSGYGFTIIIDHGNNRQTLYSHLKGTLVDAGQTVARGEPIGAAGSTGNSTGPHVHFEVRENGQRMDPLPYMRMR